MADRRQHSQPPLNFQIDSPRVPPTMAALSKLLPKVSVMFTKLPCMVSMMITML